MYAKSGTKVIGCYAIKNPQVDMTSITPNLHM